MAYGMIASFPEGPDWAELCEALSGRTHLEVFPIPSTDPKVPHRLGLALPLRAAGDAAANEIEAVVRMLVARFHATVIDLYTGQNALDILEDVCRRVGRLMDS